MRKLLNFHHFDFMQLINEYFIYKTIKLIFVFYFQCLISIFIKFSIKPHRLSLF
jgi:hypothetical protein